MAVGGGEAPGEGAGEVGPSPPLLPPHRHASPGWQPASPPGRPPLPPPPRPPRPTPRPPLPGRPPPWRPGPHHRPRGGTGRGPGRRGRWWSWGGARLRHRRHRALACRGGTRTAAATRRRPGCGQAGSAAARGRVPATPVRPATGSPGASPTHPGPVTGTGTAAERVVVVGVRLGAHRKASVSASAGGRRGRCQRPPRPRRPAARPARPIPGWATASEWGECAGVRRKDPRRGLSSLLHTQKKQLQKCTFSLDF